jgi:hypothetical protein
MGDDTWSALFPHKFHVDLPFDSFNTKVCGMYVCTYLSMYVCMYVRAYVFMYVCMYVRMHACTYVCMHII